MCFFDRLKKYYENSSKFVLLMYHLHFNTYLCSTISHEILYSYTKTSVLHFLQLFVYFYQKHKYMYFRNILSSAYLKHAFCFVYFLSRIIISHVGQITWNNISSIFWHSTNIAKYSKHNNTDKLPNLRHFIHRLHLFFQ